MYACSKTYLTRSSLWMRSRRGGFSGTSCYGNARRSTYASRLRVKASGRIQFSCRKRPHLWKRSLNCKNENNGLNRDLRRGANSREIEKEKCRIQCRAERRAQAPAPWNINQDVPLHQVWVVTAGFPLLQAFLTDLRLKTSFQFCGLVVLCLVCFISLINERHDLEPLKSSAGGDKSQYVLCLRWYNSFYPPVKSGSEYIVYARNT